MNFRALTNEEINYNITNINNTSLEVLLNNILEVDLLENIIRSGNETDIEINFLKTISTYFMSKELSILLGRKKEWIDRILRKYNLKTSTTRARWTKEEDRYLKSSWGKVSINTLQKKLDRSASSIEQRAINTLKLGARMDKIQGLKISLISKILNVSYRVIVETWPNYGLIIHTSKATPSNKNKYCLLDELLEFLRINQFLFDSRNVDFRGLTLEPIWLTIKRLEDNKLPIDYVWNYKEMFKEYVVSLLSEGYSVDETAFIVGKSQRTIHRIIKEYKLYSVRVRKNDS